MSEKEDLTEEGSSIEEGYQEQLESTDETYKEEGSPLEVEVTEGAEKRYKDVATPSYITFVENSPVKRFLEEIEKNSEDPIYAAKQQSGRFLALLERMSSNGSSADRGEETKYFYQGLAQLSGERLRGSFVDNYREMEQKTKFFSPPSGFIPRATSEDYFYLIAGATSKDYSLKQSIYQVQESSYVSALAQRPGSVTIATQVLNYNKPLGSSEPAVLLGNSITERAISGLKNTSKTVIGIEASEDRSNFHAKVGILVDQDGVTRTGFLGTQNITTALAGASTVEELFVINLGNKAKEGGITEKVLEGLTTLTNNLLNENARNEDNLGTTSPFIRTNSRVMTDMVLDIQKAAKSEDQKAVISIQYLETTLFKESGNTEFEAERTNLLMALSKLSKRGGVQISVSSTSHDPRQGLFALLDSLDSNTIAGREKDVLTNLLRSSSFSLVPTPFMHSKSYAIFDKNDELVKYVLGSGNFSANSLTNNVEAALVLEADTLKGLETEESISQGTTQSIKDYMLHGMSSFGNYSVAGLSIEASGSSKGTLKLIDALRQFDRSKETRDKAELSKHSFIYSRRYMLDPTSEEGYRLTGVDIKLSEQYSFGVTVADQWRYRRVTNEDGSHSYQKSYEPVVFFNKTGRAISGGLFKNTTKSSLQVQGYEGVIAPGQTVELAATDIVTGIINTIQYAVEFERTLNAPRKTFQRFFSSDNLADALNKNLGKRLVDIIQSHLHREDNQKSLNTRAPDFLSVITFLVTDESLSKDVKKNVLEDLKKTLATAPYKTRDITSTGFTTQQARSRFIEGLFNPLIESLDKNTVGELPTALLNRLSQQLLEITSETTIGELDTYNDLVMSLIRDNKSSRDYYDEELRTAKTKTLANTLQFFQQRHEQGYSYGQSMYALPIYGITEEMLQIQEASGAYRDENGVVNMKGFILGQHMIQHGEKLDPNNPMIQSMASTARAVEKSIWDTTGGIFTSTNGMVRLRALEPTLRTMPGLGFIDRKGYEESMKKILIEEEEDTEDRINLMAAKVFSLNRHRPKEEQILYFFPYAKTEQVGARLKNLQSTRPLLESSTPFSKFIRSFGFKQIDSLEDKSILGGEILSAMPESQFYQYLDIRERIVAENHIGKKFSELNDQEKREVDTLTLQEVRRMAGNINELSRGMLGTAAPKKTYLSMGISQLSDSGYLNSRAANETGWVHTHPLEQNFNTSNTGLSGAETKQLIEQKLRAGTFFVSKNLRVKDRDLIGELNRELVRRVKGSNPESYKSLSDTEITKLLQSNSDLRREVMKGMAESYKPINVRFDGSNFFYEFKKGVYTPQKADLKGLDALANYEQVGDLPVGANSFIIYGISEYDQTQRAKNYPLSWKFTTTSRREYDAIGVISEVNISQYGSNEVIVNLELRTLQNAEGIRTGTPQVKGPWYSVEEQYFQAINTMRALEQSGDRYLPQRIHDNPVHAIISASQIKGFNFDVALTLLEEGQESGLYKRLTRSEGGLRVAQALALLSLKDKDVREALGKSLVKEGKSQYGQLLLEGENLKSLTEMKEADGTKEDIASKLIPSLDIYGGLAVFVWKPKEGESLQKGLIKTITDALNGKQEVLDHLKTRAKHLMDLALDQEHSFERYSSKGTKLFTFNESDIVLNRSVGILAFLAKIGVDTFDDVNLDYRLKDIGGLSEISLSNKSLFTEFKAVEEERKTKAETALRESLKGLVSPSEIDDIKTLINGLVKKGNEAEEIRSSLESRLSRIGTDENPKNLVSLTNSLLKYEETPGGNNETIALTESYKKNLKAFTDSLEEPTEATEKIQYQITKGEWDLDTNKEENKEVKEILDQYLKSKQAILTELEGKSYKESLLTAIQSNELGYYTGREAFMQNNQEGKLLRRAVRAHAIALGLPLPSEAEVEKTLLSGTEEDKEKLKTLAGRTISYIQGAMQSNRYLSLPMEIAPHRVYVATGVHNRTNLEGHYADTLTTEQLKLYTYSARESEEIKSLQETLITLGMLLEPSMLTPGIVQEQYSMRRIDLLLLGSGLEERDNEGNRRSELLGNLESVKGNADTITYKGEFYDALDFASKFSMVYSVFGSSPVISRVLGGAGQTISEIQAAVGEFFLKGVGEAEDSPNFKLLSDLAYAIAGRTNAGLTEQQSLDQRKLAYGKLMAEQVRLRKGYFEGTKRFIGDLLDFKIKLTNKSLLAGFDESLWGNINHQQKSAVLKALGEYNSTDPNFSPGSVRDRLAKEFKEITGGDSLSGKESSFIRELYNSIRENLNDVDSSVNLALIEVATGKDRQTLVHNDANTSHVQEAWKQQSLARVLLEFNDLKASDEYIKATEEEILTEALARQFESLEGLDVMYGDALDNRINSATRVDPGAEFLMALQSVRRISQNYKGFNDDKVQRRANAMQRLLENTYEVVLPQLDVLGVDSETGMVEIKPLSNQSAPPARGILLGLDVMEKMSLVFQDFSHEILLRQREIWQLIESSKVVIKEVTKALESQDTGTIKVSTRALELYRKLQKLMVNTTRTSQALVDNQETIRKSMSDRMGMAGASYIAMNSFLVGSLEAAFGSRFKTLQKVDVGSGLAITFSRHRQDYMTNVNNALGQLLELIDLDSDQNKEKLAEFKTKHRLKADEELSARKLKEFKRTLAYENLEDESKERLVKEAAYIADTYRLWAEAIGTDEIKRRDITNDRVAEILKDSSSQLHMSARILDLIYGEDTLSKALEEAENSGDKKRAADLVKEARTRLEEALFGVGMVGRQGAPSGTSYTTANLPHTLKPVEDVYARSKKYGSLLSPDIEYSKTLMLLSAAGYTYTGLGDYDGDSFQVALTRVAQDTQEMNRASEELDKTNKAFEDYKKLLESHEAYTHRPSAELEGQVLQAEIAKQKELIKTMRESHVAKMRTLFESRKNLESKASKGIRTWMSSFMAMPSELMGANGIIDDEFLSSFIKQYTDTLSSLFGAASAVKPELITLISKLEKVMNNGDYSWAEGTSDAEKVEVKKLIDRFKKEDKNEDKNTALEKLAAMNKEELHSFLLARAGMEAATRKVINTTSTLVQGLVGTQIDKTGMFEIQAIIGSSGSGLLGQTYNTIVPLLAVSAGQQASQRAMESEYRESINTPMLKYLKTALSQLNEEDPKHQGLTALIKEAEAQQRRGLRASASNQSQNVTMRFLISIQQFLRDAAIKPKSDKNATAPKPSVLTESATFQYDGSNDKLKSLTQGKVGLEDVLGAVDVPQDRQEILDYFLGSKVGENLTYIHSNNDQGQEVRAFMALQLIREYVGGRSTASELFDASNPNKASVFVNSINELRQEEMNRYTKAQQARGISGDDLKSLSNDQALLGIIARSVSKFQATFIYDNMMEADNKALLWVDITKKMEAFYSDEGDESRGIQGINERLAAYKQSLTQKGFEETEVEQLSLDWLSEQRKTAKAYNDTKARFNQAYESKYAEIDSSESLSDIEKQTQRSQLEKIRDVEETKYVFRALIENRVQRDIKPLISVIQTLRKVNIAIATIQGGAAGSALAKDVDVFTLALSQQLRTGKVEGQLLRDMTTSLIAGVQKVRKERMAQTDISSTTPDSKSSSPSVSLSPLEQNPSNPIPRLSSDPKTERASVSVQSPKPNNKSFSSLEESKPVDPKTTEPSTLPSIALSETPNTQGDQATLEAFNALLSLGVDVSEFNTIINELTGVDDETKSYLKKTLIEAMEYKDPTSDNKSTVDLISEYHAFSASKSRLEADLIRSREALDSSSELEEEQRRLLNNRIETLEQQLNAVNNRSITLEELNQQDPLEKVLSTFLAEVEDKAVDEARTRFSKVMEEEAQRTARGSRKAEIFSLLAMPFIFGMVGGQIDNTERLLTIGLDLFQGAVTMSTINKSNILAAFKGDNSAIERSERLQSKVARAWQYTRVKEFVRAEENPIWGLAQGIAFEGMYLAGANLSSRAINYISNNNQGNNAFIRAAAEVVSASVIMGLSSIVSNRPIAGVQDYGSAEEFQYLLETANMVRENITAMSVQLAQDMLEAEDPLSLYSNETGEELESETEISYDLSLDIDYINRGISPLEATYLLEGAPEPDISFSDFDNQTLEVA